MATPSRDPSRESLKKDEEDSVPSEERSLTDLKFKIKPFERKRPIFNPEIMGIKKKRTGPLTPIRSSSNSNIQKGLGEGTSKSFLWSTSSSKKDVHKEADSKEEEGSSEKSPKRNILKGVERYMGCLSTRIKKGLYGGPSGPWKKQSRHVIPTKIVKEEFETMQTPEAREIMETLRRLTRPIRKGDGWMSMREAESAPLPKPGTKHGPPVSWTARDRWNKQKVGITNMDQLREKAAETPSTMSLPSSSSGGGGKVRAAKMSRQREPRAQPPSETIESESYSLDSVPKLTVDPSRFPKPVHCSTPNHNAPKKSFSRGNLDVSRELKYDEPSSSVSKSQPWKSRPSKIPTAPKEYITPVDHSKPILFSCPNYKESSSSGSPERKSVDSQVSFSFSQPKKLNKLRLGGSSQKKSDTGKVNVKGYYEQKKKFMESQPKKVESKKVELKEKTLPKIESEKKEEKAKAAESTLPPAAGGFGDFMAKQKEASQGKWTCDICMVSNTADLKKCSACETPNPKAAGEKPAETATPIPPPVAGGFADFMSKQKSQSGGKWSCDVCMVSNAADLAKCSACETPNPKAPAGASSAAPAAAAPKFSFGTSSATPATDAPKPSFTYGAAKTEEKKEDKAPTFTFGAKKTEESTTSAPSFSFGAKPAEEKKDSVAPTFSFGASTAKPATDATKPATEAAPSFTFGAATKKAEEPKAAAPSFSFGGAKTEEKKTDSAPSFSFGGAAKKEETPKIAAPSFSFGGEAKKDEAPKPAAPSFSFGGASAPKTDAAPSFSFGGAPKPAEPAVTSAPSFSFGGGSSSSTSPAATAPSFSFGGASKPAEPVKSESAAPTFSFGGSSKPKTDAAPSFNFGGAPSAPVTTSAPSFSFGGGAAAAPAAADKPFAFGGASNNISTTTTNTFGSGSSQSKPAAPSFNFGGSSSTESKPFAFGGNNDKPASTAAAAPTFNFGGSQTNDSTGSSLFGNNTQSTAAPSFSFKGKSEPSSQGSMFGNSNATTAAAPSFNFGRSSNTAANDKPFSFGGSSSQTSSQDKPFSFGGASNQNSGGSSSMFSPEQPTKQASAPSFNFGGNSSQPSSGTNMFGGNSNSQSSGFNFGGGNTNPAPSGGSMFGNSNQTSSQQPAPSFNFGGGGSQNSSLNGSFSFGGNSSQPAPGGNMFGAGAAPAANNSGVAAPRRKIVRARRNKR